MKEDKTPVRLEVTVDKKTAKAWLIQVTSGASLKNPGAVWQSYWVPESALVETDCLAAGDKGYMIVKRWIIDRCELVPDEPKQTTTDEMAELEDQLQEAREGSDRLEVVLDVDPNQLACGQGDIQINAYLTDEGLVVDVYHDGSEGAIATGYELFSEAGLHPPAPIEQSEEEDDDDE